MGVMGIATMMTGMNHVQTQNMATVSVLKMTMDSATETMDMLTEIMASMTGVGINLDISV